MNSGSLPELRPAAAQVRIGHSSLPKPFCEQRPHSLPRIFIRRLVVFHACEAVLVGIGDGEAMNRAWIADEFVLCTAFVEGVTKRLDRLGGNKGVVGAVTDQDRRLDTLHVCVGRRRQGRMEGNDRFEIRARIGQLKGR